MYEYGFEGRKARSQMLVDNKPVESIQRPNHTQIQHHTSNLQSAEQNATRGACRNTVAQIIPSEEPSKCKPPGSLT